MLNQGVFIIFVVFTSALINECSACFRYNEHKKSTLQTGSSFFQECQCTEPGYTIENLKWLDIYDQPIETGPGINNVLYTEPAQDKIYLYIPSISKSISGDYKCVTQVKGIRYVQTYTVDAYEPLYFFKTPDDQHLILHNNSVITCEARGESLPRISWQKEIDGEYSDLPFEAKYERIPEGIRINNVSMEDAGKYKCTALVISTGEECDKFIDVDVQIVPTINEIRGYPSLTIVSGESLYIDCIADGVPTPQYSWNKIETDNTNITWEQNVNTITFDNISPDDEGSYECKAYNQAGETKGLINVEVLTAPLIDYFKNITEVEGTMIQMSCNATGKPEPSISITYEGWDVHSDWESSDYADIPNGTLINLDVSHEGIYVCNASNEVGYDIVPIYLTVLHKPYFKEPKIDLTVWGYEGKSIKLSCSQQSNPIAVIFWRFDSNAIPTENLIEINKSLQNFREDYLTLIDSNTTYGMYICTARNELGESSKYFTLKEGFRPTAIETAINITDLTATSATFEIIGPFKNDAPEILGYTAQYDEAWNYNITDIHLNRTWSVDRPYKIQKLRPNTTYQISFAAVNEVGAGVFGKNIAFTTLEKSVPDSPVLEEELIQRSSSGNHMLKWKESSDNGEPIDYYILKFCPVYNDLDDRLCEVRHVESTTELEVTLESNTTYFLELIAHNAVGNSLPANISITIPALEEDNEESVTLLSGGAIIIVSIIVVFVCLILLDLLLLLWRRQGIIAFLCISKDKKKKEDALNSRDKKGLLIVEPVDTRPDNGHKEYEYNKNTGIVTGKHSAV